jgi:hypothetical protein
LDIIETPRLPPGVYSTARAEHFARALKALKNWPERTPEQILDEAARTNPTWRPIERRWFWPKSMLTVMQEHADRAPSDGIDAGKLRKTLAGMDRRTKERFMNLLVEQLPESAETSRETRTPPLRRISEQWVGLMERRHGRIQSITDYPASLDMEVPRAFARRGSRVQIYP